MPCAALPASPGCTPAWPRCPCRAGSPHAPAGWLAGPPRPGPAPSDGHLVHPAGRHRGGLRAHRAPRHRPRVLDSRRGHGEFLLAAAARWPAAPLTGIDRDAAALVVAAARLARAGHAARLVHADCLASPWTDPADLIVGNPRGGAPRPPMRPRAASSGWATPRSPAAVPSSTTCGCRGRTSRTSSIITYTSGASAAGWPSSARGAGHRRPPHPLLLPPRPGLRRPARPAAPHRRRRPHPGSGGDGRSGVAAANVLAVRTPACITVAARGGARRGSRWRCCPGDRAARLDLLGRADLPEALVWAPSAGDRFVGTSSAPWQGWPTLAQVMPWRRSGVKVGRTWPIASSLAALRARWAALVAAAPGAGSPLQGLPHRPQGRPAGRGLPPLTDLPAGSPCPPILPYAWRTLDRRWLLDDPRLHDRGAEPLREAHSPAQLYLTTGEGGVAGPGPRSAPRSLICITFLVEVPATSCPSGATPGPRIPTPPPRRGCAATRCSSWSPPSSGSPASAAPGPAGGGGAPAAAPIAGAVGRGRAAGRAPGGRVHGGGGDGAPPGGRAEPPRGHLCLGGVPILALDDPAWAFRAGGLAVLPRLVAGRLGAGRWSSPLDALGVGWSPRDTDDLARALARVRAILDLAPALAGWLDRVLAADDLWGAAEWPAAADVVR
ncbi:MAG: type ISP restriction/modification enzyme [bacterium]